MVECLQLYTERRNVEREAHLASWEEIKANDYNLNIPRYVDTFEKEEEINIAELAANLKDISAQIRVTTQELPAQAGDLTAADEKTAGELALPPAEIKDFWMAVTAV